MATVEEERAKVKLGTKGGSIYTPGTPTMQAAEAMNSNVASGVRGVIAADPQVAYAAEAGQGIRQAYAEGGVPQAIGKTIAATVAAPYAVAKDTFSGAVRDVGAFGSGVAKGMGFRTGATEVVAPPQIEPTAVAPQVQTAPSQVVGIKTAASDMEGTKVSLSGGSSAIMAPDGKISWFDKDGNPGSKPALRQWGEGAQQAPAARGLTVTNPDGTTEFVPASQGTSYSRADDPNYVELSAAERHGGAAFVPRKDPSVYAPKEIKTWGDWMTEKKERAAFGLNTARMTAEAGATKQLADAGQVAAEGESARGLRAAQKSLAEAQATNVPKQTEQLGEYYRGVVEASKEKNTAAREAAKSKTNAKIVQMDTGQVDALGAPIKGPAILNPDGTATPVTPVGLSAKIADLHASLDAKKQAAVAAKFGKRTNVDPMELHDFLRKLSTAEDK